MSLVALLLAGCGTATSTPVADDPEPAPSTATTAPPSQPVPEPVPSRTSSATRPLDDFPLARGYPPTNGTDGSPVVVSGASGLDKLVVCHEGAWTPRSPLVPVDLIGATYDGEAEDSRGITLARYQDAVAAQSVLGHVRRAVEACPDDGGTGSVYTGADRHVGDGGFLVTERYRAPYGFATALVVYDFVLVGDLLLVSWDYGEGGGSAQSMEGAQRQVMDQNADLLPELREYAVPAVRLRR